MKSRAVLYIGSSLPSRESKFRQVRLIHKLFLVPFGQTAEIESGSPRKSMGHDALNNWKPIGGRCRVATSVEDLTEFATVELLNGVFLNQPSGLISNLS